MNRYRAGKPAELPLPIDMAEEDPPAHNWSEAIMLFLSGMGCMAIIMLILWGFDIVWSLP